MNTCFHRNDFSKFLPPSYNKAAAEILFLICENFEREHHPGGKIKKMPITNFHSVRNALAAALENAMSPQYLLNSSDTIQSQIKNHIANRLTEVIKSYKIAEQTTEGDLIRKYMNLMYCPKYDLIVQAKDIVRSESWYSASASGKKN